MFVKIVVDAETKAGMMVLSEFSFAILLKLIWCKGELSMYTQEITVNNEGRPACQTRYFLYSEGQ